MDFGLYFIRIFQFESPYGWLLLSSGRPTDAYTRTHTGAEFRKLEIRIVVSELLRGTKCYIHTFVRIHIDLFYR